MSRVERIGGCTLYLGNALDILPSLEPVDLCVSDVPYKLTSGGLSKSPKTMSGVFAASNYNNNGSIVVADVDWGVMAPPIFAALKPDTDCYIMANDKNVQAALNAFVRPDLFGLHNLLTWDKVGATANRWYMKNIEFTLFLWKGRARTINDPGSKQGVTGRRVGGNGHPTEKPVWLMRFYIENSSQAGDTVIDPFMGSGTTGVACVEVGRRFVGIEIEERFFDIACERIARARPDRMTIPPEPLAFDLIGGGAP